MSNRQTYHFTRVTKHSLSYR